MLHFCRSARFGLNPAGIIRFMQTNGFHVPHTEINLQLEKNQQKSSPVQSLIIDYKMTTHAKIACSGS